MIENDHILQYIYKRKFWPKSLLQIRIADFFAAIINKKVYFLVNMSCHPCIIGQGKETDADWTRLQLLSAQNNVYTVTRNHMYSIYLYSAGRIEDDQER